MTETTITDAEIMNANVVRIKNGKTYEFKRIKMSIVGTMINEYREIKKQEFLSEAKKVGLPADRIFDAILNITENCSTIDSFVFYTSTPQGLLSLLDRIRCFTDCVDEVFTANELVSIKTELFK